MRKMSLDVGTRTIGIAVSDLLGMIANGVETIHRTIEERDYARIAELIAEHEVDTLVVGYPKNMNGTIGERAQACEAMAEKLRTMFPKVQVVLWDERRTTVTAAGILSANSTFGADRKARLDSVSAAVILESFLAWRKAHPGEEPPEVAAPTAPEQA
jgi:putative Holliday junction resolvase